MSIVRTEVQIDVTGAEQAERELKAVERAERGIATASAPASAGLNSIGRAMTGAAVSADKMKASVKQAETGVLAVGKSTSIASGAMTMLRKAAELIPGMELGTMFAAAATGVALLASKLFGAADAAAAMAKSGNVLNESMVAEAMHVKNLTDGLDRYARAMGLADAKAMTFLEHQRALKSIATGETKDVGVEYQKTEKLAEKLAALDKKLRVAVFAGTPEDELVKLRAEIARDTDILIAQDMETRILSAPASTDRTKEWFSRAFQAKKKQDEAEARKPGPKDFDSGDPWWYRERTRAALDAADAERARKNRERDFVGPGFAYPRSDDEKLGPGSFGGYQPQGPQRAAPLMSAMAQMGDSFTGTFDRMAAGATDAAGIMVQAIGTITTALGSMMTNLIISGDAGAKGLKKMAGNALAGVSAQAFGFAVFLEAAALAAALSGPILGWSAPGLATAGAVMAGAGAALGVTARMLGADQIGAARGGAKGGGGAPASAAGTNPFGGTGNQQTQVVVYIGSEVVTRGVQTETRRTALRGGITEGRMAMAS